MKINKYIIEKHNINKNLDNYVLQGITTVNELILLSAYDSSKKENSIVIVLDSNYKYLHKCTLETNSHVGGICFDPNHNKLWVTDKKGTISAYNVEEILNNNNASPIYNKVLLGYDFINIYGNNSIAFITYYENKIYAGNYNTKNTIIKEYNILDNGILDTNSTKVIISSNYIQGITFYHKDNTTYLITSSSIGRYNKSNIKMYKYKSDIDLRKDSYIEYNLPPMLEQITINQKGNLLGVFESNAKKYKTIFNHNEDLFIIDIKQIIK